MDFIKAYRNTCRLWWLKLAIGIISVVFGFWVLSHPVGAYLGLTLYFCIMLIAIGVSEVTNIIFSERQPGWTWNLTMGILDIILGIILLAYPELSEDMMPYFLSFMLMFVGIELIGQGSMMRVTRIRNWGWVIVGGSITLVVAFMIIFHPLIAVFDLIVWTSATFIISGFTTILFALRIRK